MLDKIYGSASQRSLKKKQFLHSLHNPSDRVKQDGAHVILMVGCSHPLWLILMLIKCSLRVIKCTIREAEAYQSSNKDCK